MTHKIMNRRVNGIDPDEHFFPNLNQAGRAAADGSLQKRRFDHGKMDSSFFQRVVYYWNSIDKQTREMSYKGFTKEVKKLLYSKKLNLPNSGRYTA